MNQYLYRNPLRYATLLLLLTFALPSLAQYASGRRPPPRTTPRALGVLEVDAKGGTRLIPVMLMLEGKFYDASLYGSKPVPMAIWSDTVYEAQKSGMPIGLYTVEYAKRLQSQWWGEGKWKPFATDEKKDAKSAEQKGDKKPEEKKAESKPALRGDDDPDRPTLKKPKTAGTPETSDTSGKAESRPAAADTTKPASGSTESTQARRSTSGPDDPDRPVLRRGGPIGTTQVKDEPFEDLTPAKAKEVASKRGPVQSYAAISDSGPTDNRPFDMQLNPEEQEKYGKELARLAWNELRKFAGSNATLPTEPAFANVHIRAFDLDYSNDPVMIYTAEYKPGASPATTPASAKARTKAAAAPPPPTRPVTYYITFVGKADLQGTVNKLFAAATDTWHLDMTPRMELIDAVDADADGRAELLFREITDTGRNFIVYRASPYWAKMFEGTATE